MDSLNSCAACDYGAAYQHHTCDYEARAKGSASAYTFNNYQEDTGITAVYPDAGQESERAVNYVILGLAGEAGEIANKWKKLFRDGPNFATNPVVYWDYYAKLREDILNELQDVLWYASQLATELGIAFGDVAANNIRKLNDRKQRNVLHGSGDDR